MSSGVLWIHATPSALCPHIEWAIGGVLGTPTHLEWTAQPVLPGTYRAELEWSGSPGTAGRVVSALTGWQRVRFEVTEHATGEAEGTRYSVTPSLGVFQAMISSTGDVVVPEDRLKRALVNEALAGRSLTEQVRALLGTPWDDELESFRHAGDDTGVRWLHQVV